MRRFVGPIVCFVGAFLVAIGLLAQFYVGKALLRTPLDVDEMIHVDGTRTGAQRQGEDRGDAGARVERLPRRHHPLGLEGRLLPELRVPGQGHRQPTGCVRPTTRRTGCSRRRRTTTPSIAVPRSRSTTRVPSAGALPHSGVVNKWPFLAESRPTPTGTTPAEGRRGDVRRHRQAGRARGVRLRRAGAEDEMDVAEGIKGYDTDDKQL